MKTKSKTKVRTGLMIEILLTVAICLGMAGNAFVGLQAECTNFGTEVLADYDLLCSNYIRAFMVLRMEAVQEIQKDVSFDEMNAWLQQHDKRFTEAVGEDIFDGFAFTYKGGYAHSWNYGDYTGYDPNTRPWYQTAQAAEGEVAVVAPYVTYLSGTDLIEDYDSLRMSVVQRYNDEISFDLDLNVGEINQLITNRATIYNGTTAFLYDKDGYILSSTSPDYYGHNINTPDAQISEKLSQTLLKRHGSAPTMELRVVNGTQRLIYSTTDSAGKTICLLVPFGKFFNRNLLFVLLLAIALIVMEIGFSRSSEVHIAAIEAGRRDLDAALQQANAASAAKGEFMSRMSHEIRTPLNAVIGYMSIAQDEKVESDKVRHCLENSELAAKHLLSIINDVLDISAIESGRIKIASADYNFKQQLSTIATIFYNQARNRDVDFEMKINGLTEEWVVGDQLRVNQVIMNLLSNAVKFTPAGGSVTLTVDQLEKTDETVRMRFAVRDTGIGMSQEFLARMFTPFEQESAGTAQKYGGTGLGLSISKNLTTLMGGQITVDSVQGQGTTFTVEMPFGVSAENAKLIAMGKEFSKIRVMVVDDEEDEQTYVKQLLKRLGVKSETFSDGKAAVKRFITRKNTEYAYDLCIIDWKMPDASGIEVARQIRAAGGADLPIIIATAYDVTEIDAEAKAAGVNKVIAKPLFQSSLLDLLVSVFGRYEPQGDATSAAALNLKGARILLAEDNDMNMEIAVSILGKAGLVVDTAVNGRQAVDKFLAAAPGTYKAILMDIQMPELNGYEATAAIRSSGHTGAKAVPIIAMTANAFTEDVAAAKAAGMNGHIAKPVDYEKLYRTLGECIGR